MMEGTVDAFCSTHILLLTAPAPAPAPAPSSRSRLLLFRRVCYHALRLMNTTFPDCRHYRSLLTSFLLAALVLSSAATSARNRARQTQSEPAPGAIGSAATHLRHRALRVSPAHGIAGDVSKQNRSDHPSTQTGLAPNQFSAPAAVLSRRLVTSDQPVLCLSFRASRPGGRAPPVSA